MMDYFNELKELALGSRLKRLSDKILNDAQNVYRTFGMPIQPKWFTLLALLKDKQQVSIVEASQMLGLSQPALSQFSKQLICKGLIEIDEAQSDKRKRVMRLSKKGIVTVENMQKVWKAVDKAAAELCKEQEEDFYKALITFETSLERKSLLQRTQKALAHEINQPALEFIPFSLELSIYFEVINKEWVANMFKLEPIDIKVLENPQEEIINKGGHIWFAKHPIRGIVGTCALMKSDTDEYELTKMGVLESARGLKVGEKLLAYVIEQASILNTKRLYLLTNRKCEAAIHLYEKHGFVHSEAIMQEFGNHYERCNVAMLYKK